MSELGSVVDGYDGLDLGQLPGHVLLETLEEALAQRERLSARICRLVRAADRRDEPVAETGRSTTGWLQVEGRLSRGEARRTWSLARSLDRFPDVAAAFAAGDIPQHTARDLCRALEALPERLVAAAVAALLPLAGQDPHALGGAVRALRVRLGVDDDHDAAAVRAHGERFVDLRPTFQGSWSLSGTLEPEVGEMLRLALASRLGPQRPDDDRTAGQRRHDALAALVGEHLAVGDVPDSGGERPRVVVTMTLDQFADAPGNADTPAHLDGGGHLSPATARRIACDAELLPVVLGGDGAVLDVGRTTRHWPAGIRRGARVRSGGCCEVPDCHSRAVDLHHVHWWSRGGVTSLANAAHLCAFHHWLVHHSTWTLYRTPTGLTLRRDDREPDAQARPVHHPPAPPDRAPPGHRSGFVPGS